MNVTDPRLARGAAPLAEGGEGETSLGPVDPPAPAASASMDAVAEVDAWRIFGLSDDGWLVAPFGPIFWPDADVALRFWHYTTQHAGCVVEDHPAPAEGCTCGLRGVVDRDALLAAANVRQLPGGDTLGNAGVVAKVRLSGRMLPGVNTPTDDPLTTVRAEHAEILELNLAPVHAAVASRVAAHYKVPVFAHDAEAWTGFVPSTLKPKTARVVPAGPEAFMAKIRQGMGYGMKDLDDPAAPAAFLDLGQSVCRALRGGVSLNDVLSGLFDSDAEPTFGQAKKLVRAAIKNLCPECEYAVVPDDYHHARPVLSSENDERIARYSGRRVPRTPWDVGFF